MLSRRQRRQGDADRTGSLLDGTLGAADPADEAILAVVRDLHPSVVVTEDERHHELGMLLRAHQLGPNTGPIPTVDPAGDAPSMHTATLEIGGHEVLLIDVEPLTEGRVEDARRHVCRALVEHLPARPCPPGDS